VGVTRRRPVRVANCSGFYGDRLEALAEMVGGGPVDVVTGDYLAEVTMLVLAKVRARRPGPVTPPPSSASSNRSPPRSPTAGSKSW
jgi:Acyclic terpene utilisation family protein AtuA